MTLTEDRVAEPVYSVSEAVARLEALGTLLSKGRERDGLRHFNTLYLRVTSLIDKRLGEPGFFLDPDFLRTLDVEFANLYLTAIGNALTRTDPVSPPWKKLVERRRHSGIQRFQYAAAGVNAHITFDLAQALVKTWNKHPRREGDDQRHDYDKVNDIFADLYCPIRAQLLGWIARLDEGSVRDALDAASNAAVTTTRQRAWDDAKEIALVSRLGDKWGRKGAGAKLLSMASITTKTNSWLLLPLG